MGRLITVHAGYVLDSETPETQAYLANAITLPPGPRCAECNHQMCPACEHNSWCDTLFFFDADGTPVSPLDPDPLSNPHLSFECCCNGACLFDPLDAQAFRERCAALVHQSNATQRPLLQSHGPYISPRTLRERHAIRPASRFDWAVWTAAAAEHYGNR